MDHSKNQLWCHQIGEMKKKWIGYIAFLISEWLSFSLNTKPETQILNRL
jgi:hypothetical protein